MMALAHVQHATACAEAAMTPRRVSAGILANSARHRITRSA